MTTSFDTLAQQLRDEGFKLTKPRRAILKALLATAKPLSPAEIQTRGQAYYEDLGLVTVYRTLELMEDIGSVRVVHLVDGCHGYALSTPGHTHHVVCDECHAVVEITGCDLSDFMDRVARQTGYAITGHWLETSGLGAECQKQQAQQN